MPDVTLKLDKAIEFPGQETMTELVVKPYTGKDLLECGMPFATKFDKGAATIVVDVKACRELLARMAAVPAAMIDRLGAYDFNLAVEALRSFFFVPSRAMSSSDTSPSESGAARSALPSV